MTVWTCSVRCKSNQRAGGGSGTQKRLGQEKKRSNPQLPSRSKSHRSRSGLVLPPTPVLCTLRQYVLMQDDDDYVISMHARPDQRPVSILTNALHIIIIRTRSRTFRVGTAKKNKNQRNRMRPAKRENPSVSHRVLDIQSRCVTWLTRYKPLCVP